MTRSMLIEVQKKKNTQRKALYSSEREGAIIGGTETKFKAEEERGGTNHLMSHSSHQQPEAALLYGAPKRDPHPVLQRHSVVMPKYCHLPLQSIF